MKQQIRFPRVVFRRIKQASLLFLALMAHNAVQAQEIKSINGTWVNLPYQDVRNKYMNPAHVDNTNPAFWEAKVTELHEMGITYIVIMAVANEQKAFYPSTFMERGYPSNKVSPVEAIMNTAEKLGMRVFMSCGWAISQDDDIRDPKIKEIQKKIMKETADLFQKKKSFFGWYLPVEDSMEPILPAHSVESVNSLAFEAKRLTPEAKVMISPYGICNASLSDPRFGEQIKKLHVDIIAYQDEVGCVREPLPIPRMKANFKKIGNIHKSTGIKFWSNVESFTWEKEDNSRESALIPAAFPRYLSQMVGATLAGAEEVISFSVYGTIDNPQSPMPIGQPIGSATSYLDYQDWKNKKGRWPLLEKTFRNEGIRHTGQQVNVKFNTKSSQKSQASLTDGNLGQESPEDESWLVFEKGKMDVVLDLGASKPITSLAARFLHYRPKGILLPQIVDFYVSKDGKVFEKVETSTIKASPNDRHDCWIDIAFVNGLAINARFVKVVAVEAERNQILCDEIMVNPQY